MISWIWILAIVLAIFVLMKARHAKHKFSLIIFVIFVLFVFLTYSKVVSDYDISLNSLDGVSKATTLYFSWLGHAFQNLGTLTGNAVKMDWSGNLSINSS